MYSLLCLYISSTETQPHFQENLQRKFLPLLEYTSSIWSSRLVGAVHKIVSVLRTFKHRVSRIQSLSYTDINLKAAS